jgi:hypothetical protein
MLCLFLSFASSVRYVLGTICPCDRVRDACDPNCSCDPLCTDRNYSESFPIRRPDEIPTCPSGVFQSRLPLGTWLRNEIFCISTDHRKSVPKGSFSEEVNPSYAPPLLLPPDVPPQGPAYAYNQPLVVDPRGTFFTVPGPASGVAKCVRGVHKVGFLVPIAAMTCSGTVSLASLPRSISSLSQRAQVRNSTDGAPLDDDDGVVASADYVFTYTDTTIQSFAIDVTFGDNDTTEFRVSVRFVNADSPPTTPKSGEVGYVFNQPVIAAIESGGYFFIPNETAGTFPIPFGYDCEALEYTPLHFGVDTIGGCTLGEPREAILFTNYSHFAINGRANPAHAGDWIPVDHQQCLGITPLFQRFIFFYEKFGSSANAQYRLNSVLHLCDGKEAFAGYIVTASFVLVADQPLVRYSPPNPRAASVPRDTWYPFSSSAGIPLFSAPSAYVMAACVVLAVFFVQ